MRTQLITGACLLAACNLFAAVDKNYNGLSDVYEFIYFNAPAEPFADPDGDGVSNYDEMFWGTNPTNTASKVVGPTATLAESDLTLTWSTAPFRTYELQGSTDLETWQTVASGTISSHAEHLAAPGTPPWRFYRLQIILDTQDTNGNGLADWEEASWQTAFGQAPALTDIDGDHLPDDQELLLGRSPGKKDHPAIGLVVFTPLEK